MTHRYIFILLTFLLAGLTTTAAPAERLDRNHKKTARQLNFRVEEKPSLRGGLAGLPLPADELNVELENFFAALSVLPEIYPQKRTQRRCGVRQSPLPGNVAWWGHRWRHHHHDPRLYGRHRLS